MQHDLRSHGDTQVPDGCVDLAVNVLAGPPAWLRRRMNSTMADLSAYPDQLPAQVAAASHHDRPANECLLLNGGAEAFWLLPRVLRPRHAAIIHPTFTEGEAALRAAGVPVTRVQRDPDHDWRFDPDDVPADADMVLLTRPNNPTGTLDDTAVVEQLCRGNRTVVVDEAFIEMMRDATGVAARRDLAGLVVLRSLTKVWGLAGLRVGYLLAAAPLVTELAAARQPWSVNSLALDAIPACLAAENERRGRVREMVVLRQRLHDALARLPEVQVWTSAGNFLLMRTPSPRLRDGLLRDGLAVRRCDTFPGLDSTYLRVTIPDIAVQDQLVASIGRHLSNLRR